MRLINHVIIDLYPMGGKQGQETWGRGIKRGETFSIYSMSVRQFHLPVQKLQTGYSQLTLTVPVTAIDALQHFETG